MKQNKPTITLPTDLKIAFDQLEVSLNEIEQLIGTDITDNLRDEIQRANEGFFEAKRHAHVMAYDYAIRNREATKAEDDVERLEEILEKLGSSDVHSKLSALRDPANWKHNEWKPFLTSTEPDILRYLDEAFAEVV